MHTRTHARRTARPVQRANARELPWSYIFLVIVCGAVLAAGFFFAGLQHFTSMEYGIKNSKLRKQVESLEAEKRRLMLAKEVTLSPRELRKAARGVNARNAELVRASQNENAAKSQHSDAGSVVKTAATAASAKPMPGEKLVTATVKSEPVNRRNTEDKKDKFEITAVAKLR
jgi:hypothetical protein